MPSVERIDPTFAMPPDLLPSGGSEMPRAQARLVVEGMVARRMLGEEISDEQVIGSHPHLSPYVAEELAAVQEIRIARLYAQKAAQTPESLPVFTDTELEAPICLPNELTPGVDPYLTVSGYRIRREISSGGQATVYEAVHEATGRKVAIKMLAGGPFVASRHRKRFDREAGILASLEHPNIVGILDRGRTGGGGFFLVMNYVEGLALDAHIKLNRPALKDLLELFATIATAVGAAHEKGIVHRDLKPANIRVDGRGAPHVLDFGLARLTGGSVGSFAVHSVTDAGQLVGSLPWASPEQAAGQSDRLDASSDIYSLGVMLYQGLTGDFPYRVDGSLSEVLENIRSAPVQAPSGLAGPFTGQVSNAVDQIVLRALSKSPSDRYRDAVVLAEDLRCCAQGTPLQAQTKKDYLWLKHVIVWIALIGGLAAVAVPWPKPDRKPSVLQLPRMHNSVGMELVRVPAGQFLMGCAPNEEGYSLDDREHTVRILREFYMATTEVTRGQFVQVMGRSDRHPWIANDRLPAAGISLTEANEFCQKLSGSSGGAYRLPTEEEWEYACRAGSSSRYGAGALLDDVAWHESNSGHRTHPVAQKQPNIWGLYDMHGNVAEWCTSVYAGIQTNGIPSLQTSPVDSIIRGGNAIDEPISCRSASRGHVDPATQSDYIGFRVVMENPSAPTPRPALPTK